MVMKVFVHHMLCIAHYCDREPNGKNDGNAIDDQMVSTELSSISAVHPRHKDTVVRIVLASGMVEVYAGIVLANQVMEKYPGLCLARPEVFKRPHEALVGPSEKLLPGQKFYLIPRTTVKKIKRKFHNKLKGDGEENEVKEVISDKEKEEKNDGESIEEPVCSAKDFYVSNEKWEQCFMRRYGIVAEKFQQKWPPFRPPTKKLKNRQGLLGGWKPTLTSVEELSPY